MMVMANKFAAWCCAVIVLVAAPLAAQDAKVPQGKEVLSRYFQAMGGEAKLVEGIEAEQAKLANSHPVPQLDYAKYFESIECTGVEEFDAVDCFAVKYIKSDRKPTIDYFEKSTGLLRGTRQTMVTNQGNVEMQITLGDYRDVDGIKYPFTSVMSLGPGLAMEFQLTSFKANTKFEPKQFELPADVAALK